MAKSKKTAAAKPARTSVSREELNALFAALGSKAAVKWSEKRLRSKIAELPGLNLSGLQHPHHRSLADFLIGALEDERMDDLPIDEIEGEEGAEVEQAVEEETPAGQKVKSKRPSGVPAQKTKAGAPAAKAGGAKPKAAKAAKVPTERKPGVISTILDILKAASEKAPVKKEDIVAKLAATFPDRDEDGMRKTVNVQVPTRLGSDKGVTVQKNENGYWV